MSKIKLHYRSILPPYKASEAEKIFKEYADLTDARRYFSDEEIEKSKESFIADLMNGNTKHYINHILQEKEEVKPDNLHGVYDLGLIRSYERIIALIEAF